ncbi:MAG: hypothetical protein ABL974_21510 [Prosthecobacter sp.]
MKIAHLALAVGLLMFVSCSSVFNGTSRPSSLSPEAGKRQAQRDFAAGKPKVYEAGGYAVFVPGITDDQKALVAKLPRDVSLAGCTNPKVQYSMGFATAYNQQIVSLLLLSPHGQ